MTTTTAALSGTGFLFRARWPIHDDNMTLTQLKVEACADIDRIAAQAGAHITGPITWTIDGLSLIAEAAARPQPTPDGKARQGFVTSQTALIRDLAGRGLSDAQIAAAFGCTRYAVYQVRRKHGIPPGVLSRPKAAA